MSAFIWFSSWSCSQAVSKPVWRIPLLFAQWKPPDDGQRNCPKHVEFYSKNKFEKSVHLKGKCKSAPLQARGAQMFPGSSRSQITWQWPRIVVRLSALRAGRLYPQEILLVLISVRGWFDPQGHSAIGRIMSMKNSNDTIRNRTSDFPICSTAP